MPTASIVPKARTGITREPDFSSSLLNDLSRGGAALSKSNLLMAEAPVEEIFLEGCG